MRFILPATLAITLAANSSALAQLPNGGAIPPLSGAGTWLNSKAITTQQLRGKVVLIDFWTYSCINCLRALPYVKAWDAKYRQKGLVVIGVHAPEFGFEHDATNVKRAVKRLGITYPVVLDNDMKIWNAFRNQYWPAHYFIDRKGRVRHSHFGEGGYEESEDIIRQLLAEDGPAMAQLGRDTAAQVSGSGILAAADDKNIRSPETYVGYKRGSGFVSVQSVQQDAVATYTAPHRLAVNTWALTGLWRVTGEYAVSSANGAAISFRFHARDLNLVLGPSAKGGLVKFRVTVDGLSPGKDAGADVTANGDGVIMEHRLYQLVRQSGPVRDRTFIVTFQGPGAQVYAFTFG